MPKLLKSGFLVFFLPQFLGNPQVSQETALGKTSETANVGDFGMFFASYRPPSGNLSSDSCRGGHKLRNEYSNIKMGQVLSSEMRKM